MNGSSVAIDTNMAAAVLNDDMETIAWLNGFAQLLLPVQVLGELMFGFMNSSRAASNLPRLRAFVTRCTVLETTQTTAEHYAATRLTLKQQGKPIPENDLWIAATCLQHAVPLATRDTHFAAVSRLVVVQP